VLAVALLEFFQAIAGANLIGPPDEPFAADDAALWGICSQPLPLAFLGASYISHDIRTISAPQASDFSEFLIESECWTSAGFDRH
jgi:hypothetical protein